MLLRTTEAHCRLPSALLAPSSSHASCGRCGHPRASQFGISCLVTCNPQHRLQLGLVAGGLADGSIGVWNPDTVLKAKSDAEDVPEALLSTLRGHTGPVRIDQNNQCTWRGAAAARVTAAG